MRLALGALGLSFLMADGGLREDEIDCEEAVALLQQCCPGFAATSTTRCEFSDGCGTVLPALSIEESQCITAMDCSQIVAAGLCDKAHDLVSPGSETDQNGDAVPDHPPVCP